MDPYPLLIFLHVTGGVTVAAAVGVEAVVFPRLRRITSVEQARPLLSLLLATQSRIFGGAMALVLITGGAMAAARWGMPSWIIAALAAVVVLAVTGMTVLRRTLIGLAATVTDPAADAASVIRSTASGRTLRMALAVRAAVTIGILALMTVKPSVVGTATIAAAAVLIGLVAGARPRQAPSAPAPSGPSHAGAVRPSRPRDSSERGSRWGRSVP
jgi:hypothetical protein